MFLWKTLSAKTICAAFGATRPALAGERAGPRPAAMTHAYDRAVAEDQAPQPAATKAPSY